VARDEVELDELIDMSAKRPFVDTADAAANLDVRGEHGITVPWPEKRQEGLKGLNVARLESEHASSIAKGAEYTPDVWSRVLLVPVSNAVTGDACRKLIECHFLLNDGHVGPQLPATFRGVSREKRTKITSTESVTLDRYVGDCYIIGANR
jgi:hypothetical protein